MGLVSKIGLLILLVSMNDKLPEDKLERCMIGLWRILAILMFLFG